MFDKLRKKLKEGVQKLSMKDDEAQAITEEKVPEVEERPAEPEKKEIVKKTEEEPLEKTVTEKLPEDEPGRGEVPGEKFSLLGRELDFSSWNADKYDSLMADPVMGLVRFGKQLDGFVASVGEIERDRDINAEKKADLQEKMEQIKESDGQDKANVFYKNSIEPLVLVEAPMYLNIRYHTLSALSFRRYIMGKLYLEMKSRYIMDAKNPVYKEFLSDYNRILSDFEIYIVPYMNPRDL